ncbi:hypothetical protein F5X68DRAFT_205698 [Plectosphaerella plurivora]|uniref:Uncharacterized protein n=1 Tax=Plectosphaerella plurivora TaxID=936078 RepID=A0A9P8VBX7_9PEZI|nr:hypothetical protein F5X68DRAFT_205698 [Plectosphaerella plurivora]
MEALGSTTNPYALMMMQDRLQNTKARLESYTEPMSSYAMRSLLRQATTASDPQDIDDALNALMAPLHDASTVFELTQDPQVKRQIQWLRALVATQLGIVEQNCPGGQGLVAHWAEFFPYYFSAVSWHARRWARGHIGEMRAFYQANPGASARDAVLEALEEREGTVERMRYAFELEQ